MALGSQPRWTVRPAAGSQVDVDVGLRDYMLRIYNYMASGLALTGIVAFVFAQYLETHRALALGFAGTWRALGAKPARYLRNE